MIFLRKRIYILIFILLIVRGISSQNYYETLGDYKIELTSKLNISQLSKENDSKEYELELNIYDSDDKLLSAEYLSGNSYDFKKFTVNNVTGEQMIFLITSHTAANAIPTDLYCIVLENVSTLNGNIQVPHFLTMPAIDYSLISVDPKLEDILLDIDNDGQIEITYPQYILLGNTGRAAGSFLRLIFQLKDCKFVLSNEKYPDLITNEIDELKSSLNQYDFTCKEQNNFVISSYQNLLCSIVLSYYLINKLHQGLSYYDRIYKCENSNWLKKRILAYYYDVITFEIY